MGASSQPAGYNYRVAWHDGLGKGPWDAFTEFRGADKTAWKGRVEVNTAIRVIKPDLWGGKKDQGGPDGTLTPMFGLADQLPNASLVSMIGPKITASRGMMTAAWHGIWGANNPFQQKRSYRGERTYAGWDNDDCWYASKVRVPIEGDFTPGTPGSVTYRWAIRHADNYVAGSPDGQDWSEESAFLEGLGSERNFGDLVVSTAQNGETSYAPSNNPGAWVPGANAGATGFFQARTSIINGQIFQAKGNGGYAYTNHPATAYTHKTGRAALTCGNAEAILFYAGPKVGGYTDGYFIYRSVDGGSTREHVATIATSTSPGAYNYAYYLNGAAASETAHLFGGHDYIGNSVIFYTHNSGASMHEAVMPLGQLGDVREILHVGGAEFLAFVSDVGGGGEKADCLLRSTDNGASWQVVDLETTGYFAHWFQGNAAVDPSTGQVVFILFSSTHGTRVFESMDRTTWTQRVVTFAPNTVYLISPSDPGTPPAYGRIAKNPAHMVLEMHTQKHCGRQPRDSVNLDHLTTQADWFYSRGFGLCVVRNPKETSPREFIKRIEQVAGCSFTKSLADGLWYLDVANGIYDLDSLQIISDDHVLKFKETASTSDNVVNSVSVKYFDPERKEIVITPPIKAMGLIAQFGEIHQTFEYLEIPIGRIALEVAERELLARITPTRAFELDCNPGVYELRRNQYVRLQLPKRGIADMVCLVAEIPTSGSLKSGAFQLKLAQDIYSLPTTQYVVELGEDTSPPTTPVTIEDQIAFEAPYIDVVASMPAADFAALPADAGYVMGAAVDPGRMRDFTMMVAPDGGEYDDVGDGQFCPSCTSAGLVEPGLQEGIGFTDPSRLASVQVGDVGWWDGELVRVDVIDLDANTLNLGRGCGDTLPRQHLAGSRIFFYQSAAAFDRTQHIAGEALDVKLLSNSYTEQQDITTATALDVTMAQRIDRPYNNGRMEINGVSIFAIGTSTPGGGGGGPGGGGGGAEHPVRIGPSGVPLSAVPGPNGGFPDDAEYPIPQPTTVDTDIMPGGDFSDPEDLAVWRKQDGSPLGTEWALVDDELTFEGARGTAYGYGIRLSLPIMPFPRYSAEVTAKIRTTRGMRARFGVAWGPDMTPIYIDAADGVDFPQQGTDYPDQTLVTHVFELPITQAAQHGSSKNLIVTFMPVVEFISDANASSVGKVDDVTLTVTRLVPATTALTPANLDFSAGLTGWTMWPDPTGNPYAPTISVSGGEVSMTGNSKFFDELRLICDDPITDEFEIGKYFGMDGEVWSNDSTLYGSDASNWITAGGVAMGYVVDRQDGTFSLNYGGMAERGDWTPREMYMRCKNDLTNLPVGWTIKAMATLVASPGFTTKLRNLGCKITDEVID